MDRTREMLILYKEKYHNTYGFTSTAVERIKRTLENTNVIIDALGSKNDWSVLLNNKPIVMLYFAPNSLELTEDRMRKRMQSQSGKINKNDLITRTKANAENIHRDIGNYDYWIDTTDLSQVVPAVTSVIRATSYGGKNAHPRVVSIVENPVRINQLIEGYSIARTKYG